RANSCANARARSRAGGGSRAVIIPRRARVAEPADAADSKSAAFHEAWGFESPLWHLSAASACCEVVSRARLASPRPGPDLGPDLLRAPRPMGPRPAQPAARRRRS